MAVHNVIKSGNKTNLNKFLVSSFQSGFQWEQFDYTCTAKVCLGEIEHVHHIGVTSDFAYVELWITRSIFAIPLDFEIVRLTCTYI